MYSKEFSNDFAMGTSRTTVRQRITVKSMEYGKERNCPKEGGQGKHSGDSKIGIKSEMRVQIVQTTYRDCI